MLGDLRCQTCGAVTRRALLHDHEPEDYRNLAEDEDHARMLPREIDRQHWRVVRRPRNSDARPRGKAACTSLTAHHDGPYPSQMRAVVNRGPIRHCAANRCQRSEPGLACKGRGDRGITNRHLSGRRGMKSSVGERGPPGRRGSRSSINDVSGRRHIDVRHSALVWGNTHIRSQMQGGTT
jgi:hypothetical protein